MSAAAETNEQQKRFKEFTTKASASGLPEGQIWFTASKETEDRDTDVVRVNGIKTTHFEANPVFLWAHDQSAPPIGKANQVKAVGDELQMLIEFDMNDPFAAMIYDKYVNGFLNAVSIGFLAFEGGVKQRKGGGYEFMESELLELSAVPVPSNREALAFAREFAAYVDHPQVQSWAKALVGGDEEEEVPVISAPSEDIVPDGVPVDVEDDRDAVTDEEIDKAFEAKRKTLSADELGIELQMLDLNVELDEDERAFVAEAIKEATGRTVHVSKAGRVLSAANFGKLTRAKEAIEEVLQSATPQKDEHEEKSAEPVWSFEEEEEGVSDADGNQDGDTEWSFE